MVFETGLFLNKIPYIKTGSGAENIVIFYGGSAILQKLTESSIKHHLNVIQAYVPAGYTCHIFGYEEYPAEPYSLHQIADDFARVIQDKIGSAIIVGVSFGGFAAMRFAAKYPELTKKLVLLITAHRFSENGERKINRLMDLAQNERFYDLVKEYSLLFRSPWLNLLVQFMIWKNKEKILNGLKSRTVILNSLTGLFSEDVYRNIDYLCHIRAKTIIIGGRRDPFFSVKEFQETAEAIPGAELRLFETETHMLPVERKNDVAKVVKEFVTGVFL